MGHEVGHEVGPGGSLVMHQTPGSKPPSFTVKTSRDKQFSLCCNKSGNVPRDKNMNKIVILAVPV